MEYTEGAVRDFLTGVVRDALGDTQPDIALNFAQVRFVKTDPAIVTCTWPQAGGAKGREFNVCFSGHCIETFTEADEQRLARLRHSAIEAIRAGHKSFDPKADAVYPAQCLIDRLDA